MLVSCIDPSIGGSIKSGVATATSGRGGVVGGLETNGAKVVQLVAWLEEEEGEEMVDKVEKDKLEVKEGLEVEDQEKIEVNREEVEEECPHTSCHLKMNKMNQMNKHVL